MKSKTTGIVLLMLAAGLSWSWACNGKSSIGTRFELKCVKSEKITKFAYLNTYETVVVYDGCSTNKKGMDCEETNRIHSGYRIVYNARSECEKGVKMSSTEIDVPYKSAEVQKCNE